MNAIFVVNLGAATGICAYGAGESLGWPAGAVVFLLMVLVCAWVSREAFR